MFWKKKKTEEEITPAALTWNEDAKQALDQAVNQAPAPSMVKGRLKKELSKAAEQHTQKDGRTTVTAEDLMHGMLAKLPANMRTKVEDAMKEGPDSIDKLKKDLGQ